MRRAYVDLSRGQLHFRYAGNGCPLLLLHMSGSSSDEYEKAGELLSGQYSVYALDLFGFGASDQPSEYLSVSQHMDTVREFCEALCLGPVNLAGNLVGANIACRLAAAFPSMVDRLALFHICCHPDPDHYKNLRDSPVFAEIPLSPDGSHLMKLWARSAKYQESPEATDDRFKCLHMAGPLGESLHWALCDDADFTQCLSKIQAPSKIFAYDFMDTDAVSFGASLIPGSRFELLEHTTPYFSRVNPGLYAAKVIEALE